MLVFELHSSEDGSLLSIKKDRRSLLSSTHDRHFVKLYFVAASPEQMRNGEALSDENVRFSSLCILTAMVQLLLSV